MVLLVATASASAKTITVDDDLKECPHANYTSIQAAINNATDGDIILIYNGTYSENVVVNKTLNLTGIGMPVIDGMNNGNTMKIEADNCTIKNFKVINSAGDWNLAGIHIASSNNIICNNTISSNKGHGIGIYSGNNKIYSNILSSNGWAGVGIYAGGNNIYSNDIQNNGYGFRLFQAGGNIIYSNIIENNGYGFYHYASSSNTIYSNIISSNSADAFYIWNSGGNEISRNEISGSNRGFEIWIYSGGNSIYENNITNNNKGVYIYYPSYASSNNLFYHNNFIENTENNTWDECTNNWYNETLREGNYYDDYEGMDADKDGIGDTPYNISGGDNQDLYPLMEPYVENKPPVACFTYSPENPAVNETIIFNASISYDPDGNITSYEWEFGDGDVANATGTGTGEIVEHSYSSPGNYTVNLTVTDNEGAINSTSKTVRVVEKKIFDTGEPENPYPSIFGTHDGTITPYKDIYVASMFTYSCAGTGGHTEFIRIYGNGLNESASWNGYTRDWHNISFDAPFTLKANLTYNYTIRTGSYPQIHHTDALQTANGWINCTEFVDANGMKYYDWIPAIMLE
jgi:parallel beta-helix repeat protein